MERFRLCFLSGRILRTSLILPLGKQQARSGVAVENARSVKLDLKVVLLQHRLHRGTVFLMDFHDDAVDSGPVYRFKSP